MYLQLLSKELRQVAIVSIFYCFSVYAVTIFIAPLQRLLIPEVTLFAALIFPPHGVRVLTAWFYGARSIAYLLIAAIFTHFVLFSSSDVTAKTWLSWVLISSVAWLSFEIIRLCGINLYKLKSNPSRNAWRSLILVGFISSILNSLGHNIIYAGEILPENTLGTLLAFIVGDTIGTFVCFIVIMLVFRFLAPRPTTISR